MLLEQKYSISMSSTPCSDIYLAQQRVQVSVGSSLITESLKFSMCATKTSSIMTTGIIQAVKTPLKKVQYLNIQSLEGRMKSHTINTVIIQYKKKQLTSFCKNSLFFYAPFNN